MMIGIYPRKSVYRDNSDSVQVQIQLCKEYAGIVYKGQDIEFKVYDKDEGFSGKNTKRPGFQELMQDVRSNILNVVIVYRLDRISRNVQEFSAMYEVFQQHDVSFISVKESFDTTTPMGRTVMYILAAFAQLERENISERVSDNMHALGAAGIWTGGKLPSGFTSIRLKRGEKEHSFLKVDTSTIWRAKKLFELILQGYTITKVERYCRDNGIQSQSGKFLNTSQIYNILTNPVYCQNSVEAYYYFLDKGCSLPDMALFDGTKGLIAYGRTKAGSTAQKTQSMDNWNIAVGIHDAVIPSADWIAVQNRLGINKMVRTAKYECGILKGVARCACGARMNIRTYQKNGIFFSYYYCSDMARQGKGKCNSSYIRIEEVDEAFLKELRKIRFQPNGFTLRENCSPAPDIVHIKSDIKQTEASIENLTTALTQAMDTTAAAYIIKSIEKLDKEKRALELKLRNANLLLNAAQTQEEAEQKIYDNICYLLDNFNSINYDGKRELINKIISSCILDTNTKSLNIVF